ncbi:hypothetical protein VB796_06645 [Arcicella sp. LKC2W]|uniref:hypothetical protein n=1 Tax=Arcicella sp. LKC2W TaxID=2984198 RepID=UPI002B20077D|nr:hypothetical protein [Arcicella sp. LKC2W]MEA5458706.1 hypothetical protein [Arcicella sp. LKC2W]
MERLTKEFLIEQGFVKDERAIVRWTYKGIGGNFSVGVDGIGRFYFFDFNPAIEYQCDLLFMQKLIDHQQEAKIEKEKIMDEPTLLECIHRISEKYNLFYETALKLGSADEKKSLEYSFKALALKEMQNDLMRYL